MTDDRREKPPRKPRAFRIEDVSDARRTENLDEATGTAPSRRSEEIAPRPLSADDLARGIRWGGILLSAATALASLAAGLWFTRFVSVALERSDWIGWTAFGLMVVIAGSLAAMVLREIVGFRRMARLTRLKKSIMAALGSSDRKAERDAIAMLVAHYRGRADMSWGLARLADHAGDVLDPGELLRLADRELLAVVDTDARRAILQSAKRVATVTTLSPILWIAMAYVLVENVRMFRAIAGLYGGRPGTLGALRLARLVVTHVIATGGVALTDDLLGQFLGQDVLRRVSRRLGEGAFNGALTARLGVVAVEVTRPLPFLDSEPLRVREIFSELVRSLRGRQEQN